MQTQNAFCNFDSLYKHNLDIATLFQFCMKSFENSNVVHQRSRHD